MMSKFVIHTRNCSFALALVSLLVWMVSVTTAQAAPAASGKTLNLVIRDQSGALVNDIKADEIEILDNGVKQAVQSFRSPAEMAKSRPLLILVFGGLGNEGRQYARQAALDLLKELPPDQAQAAVLVIDRRLYLEERFTSKRKDQEAGISLATSGAFEKYKKQSDTLEKAMKESKAPLSDPDRILLDMIGKASQAMKEDWSYAALDSLNLLVDELGRLPGRKSVIFFSEGLVIQETMVNRFNLLVSAANAAQVAINTVDARGLLSEGVTGGTRDMLAGAQGASASQFGSTSATEGWQVKALETAGQSVRMNVQESLANLADQTGGTLLANTNDARSGVKRFAEDLVNYYQVTYSPQDLKGDGALRPLVVNSSRAQTKVFSPRAYLDFPYIAGEQVVSFELPLLELLNSGQFSNTFNIGLDVLHFGAGPEGTQHTLAVTMPMTSVTIHEDQVKQLYTTAFSILAAVRDESGQVVQKFSQDYPLQGPLAKVGNLKSGNIMFLRNFMLPAGKYTIEAAARDNLTEKSSAIKEELAVSDGSQKPALSSVVVVDRADKITDAAKEQGNPLRYKDMKIVPNLGTPIPKKADEQISFYCVLYPAADNPQPPVMALLFFKDGQPLFQGKPPLPAPDDQGHVQVVLSLPLQGFQAGQYEVVAVVQQGDAVAEERGHFAITESPTQ